MWVMQRGNWVPINKEFTDSLPVDRPYTELEAAFCITCDYDKKRKASISGYAKLWQWSRKRVASFAKKTGWSLSTTRAKRISLIDLDRTKTGKVVHDPTWNKRDKQGTSGEQAGDKQGTSGEQAGDKQVASKTNTYRDEGTSGEQAGNKQGTSREQAGDKQGSSTIYPNPNPNPKKKKTARQKVMDMKPDWWSTEQWTELINHRKKKGAVLTVRAYKTLLNEFEVARAAGDSAEDILNDMSSGKGWTGYKWEWAKNRRASESLRHGQNNKHNGVNNHEKVVKRDYRKGATRPENLPECLRPQ